MLIKYYPNPNNKKVYDYPLVTRQQQHSKTEINDIKVFDLSDKAHIPAFSEWVFKQAAAKKITPFEWTRRDRIIRQAATEAKFKAGDTVYPSRKIDYDKYGECVIVSVAYCYHDYCQNTEEPWKDDQLYLYMIQSRKNNIRFVCTLGYVSETAPT